MKKIYFVIIVIALFLVFGYGCSNSNSEPMTENFEFAANTDGKSYYVSKYNGNDRLVYIPDQFNGYPVTSIGSNAFYNNSAIEKIIVPKTIETIYSSAFSGVENLREIEFEEDSNLISIGENALLGCKNLLNISIPNSVTSIGDYAFSGCSSLTSIIIPDSVTSIGSSAFRDCSKLTIYVEAPSKPSGWDSTWNYSNRPVVWGYNG